MVAIEENPRVDDRNEETPVALNIRSLTFGLRRDFKVWCAQQNKTMEQAVIELMEQAIEGHPSPTH